MKQTNKNQQQQQQVFDSHKNTYKSSSQSSRDPQPSSIGQKTQPWTQVSVQSASASNLLKYQNLNSSNKQIQPVLRQKEESATKLSSNSQQRNQLSKNSSGQLDKKVRSPQPSSQSKNQKIKGQTFAYEEQHHTQSVVGQGVGGQDGTPNRQLFKKTVQSSSKTSESKKKVVIKQDEDEQFIEVNNNQDQNMNLQKMRSGQNDQFVEMRPSDEVQYQELIMDEKESSIGSSQLKNSSKGYQMYQSNSQFSPQVINEEPEERRESKNFKNQRSGDKFKNQDFDNGNLRNVKHMKIEESGFKVHDESYRGGNSLEDRIIPIEQSPSRRENQYRQGNQQQNINYQEESDSYQQQNTVSSNQFNEYQRNSDLKKFNMDEDLHNQQQLRVIRQTEEEEKEKGREQYFNQYQEEYDQQQYPQQEQHFQDFQPASDTNDTPKHLQNKIFTLGPKSQDYQNLQQNQTQFFSDDQDYNSQQQQQYNINQNTFSLGMEQVPQQNQQQREHLLSFADKSQLYVEYPPLQQNNTSNTQNNSLLQSDSNLIQSNDMVNYFRPMSPSALKQQQRLQDILKTSQGDMSQLHAALQSQKIDEQQLNNMIDLEKNYVIMQYESILQQLNVEFHKLLSKNKEMEETLNQKETFIKTQQLVIADREESLFQQEQINRQLKNQISDLMSDNVMTTQRTVAQEVENFRMERDLQDQKIHSLQGQVRSHQNIEEDLREQLESVQNRLRASEQNLRSKEELTFQIERDKQKLLRDLKNLGDIDFQMKEEIKTLNQSRLKLEDQLQEEKQKGFQLEMSKRQREMELENVIRDNRSLKGTVDLIQQNVNELTSENFQLKEQLTESERVKLQLRGSQEKCEREMKKLQSDLKRNQQMMQDTQEQLDRMSVDQNHSHSVDFKRKQQQSYNTYRNEQDSYQREQFNNSTKRLSNDFTNDSSNFNLYQKPLQEQNPNSFSPLKKAVMGAGQNFAYNTNQQSPLNSFNQSQKQANDSSKNIVWLSQGQSQQEPQQQFQNTRNNPKYDLNERNTNNQMNGVQRKRTIVNQNESQLQDFFQWPSQQPNQQQMMGNPQNMGLARSLERPNKGQQQYQMQDNNQWSKKSNANLYNQQVLFQYKQINVIQEQELPPAGKKTILNVGQSPLPAKKNKNSEQQMSHMQNSLSALQIEKEMVSIIIFYLLIVGK